MSVFSYLRTTEQTCSIDPTRSEGDISLRPSTCIWRILVRIEKGWCFGWDISLLLYGQLWAQANPAQKSRPPGFSNVVGPVQEGQVVAGLLRDSVVLCDALG